MLTRLAPDLYLFSSGIAGACLMLRLVFFKHITNIPRRNESRKMSKLS